MLGGLCPLFIRRCCSLEPRNRCHWVLLHALCSLHKSIGIGCDDLCARLCMFGLLALLVQSLSCSACARVSPIANVMMGICDDGHGAVMAKHKLQHALRNHCCMPAKTGDAVYLLLQWHLPPLGVCFCFVVLFVLQGLSVVFYFG